MGIGRCDGAAAATDWGKWNMDAGETADGVKEPETLAGGKVKGLAQFLPQHKPPQEVAADQQR